MPRDTRRLLCASNPASACFFPLLGATIDQTFCRHKGIGPRLCPLKCHPLCASSIGATPNMIPIPLSPFVPDAKASREAAAHRSHRATPRGSSAAMAQSTARATHDAAMVLSAQRPAGRHSRQSSRSIGGLPGGTTSAAAKLLVSMNLAKTSHALATRSMISLCWGSDIRSANPMQSSA